MLSSSPAARKIQKYLNVDSVRYILWGTRVPNLVVSVILGYIPGYPQSVYTLVPPRVYTRVPREDRVPLEYIPGYLQRICPNTPRVYTWVPPEYTPGYFQNITRVRPKAYTTMCSEVRWRRSKLSTDLSWMEGDRSDRVQVALEALSKGKPLHEGGLEHKVQEGIVHLYAGDETSSGEGG